MWSYFYGKEEDPPPKSSSLGPWSLEQLKMAISTGAVDGLLLQRSLVVESLRTGVEHLPTLIKESATPFERHQGGGGGSGGASEVVGIIDPDENEGGGNHTRSGSTTTPFGGYWCCLEESASLIDSGIVTILLTLLQFQAARPKVVSLVMDILFEIRDVLSPDQFQSMLGPLVKVMMSYRGRKGLMTDTDLSKTSETSSGGGGTSSSAPQEEVEKNLLPAEEVVFRCVFFLLKGTVCVQAPAILPDEGNSLPAGSVSYPELISATLSRQGSATRSIPYQVASLLQEYFDEVLHYRGDGGDGGSRPTVSLKAEATSSLLSPVQRQQLASQGGLVSGSIMLRYNLLKQVGRRGNHNSSASAAMGVDDLEDHEDDDHLSSKKQLLSFIDRCEWYHYSFLTPWLGSLLAMGQDIYPIDLTGVRRALCCVLVDAWTRRVSTTILPTNLFKVKMLAASIFELAFTEQWISPSPSEVSHLVTAMRMHEGETFHTPLSEVILATLSRLFWAAPPYATQIQPVLEYAHHLYDPLVMSPSSLSGDSSAQSARVTLPPTSLVVAAQSLLAEWLSALPHIKKAFSSPNFAKVAEEVQLLQLIGTLILGRLPTSGLLLQEFKHSASTLLKFVPNGVEGITLSAKVLTSPPSILTGLEPSSPSSSIGSSVMKLLMDRLVLDLRSDSLHLTLPLVLHTNVFQWCQGFNCAQSAQVGISESAVFVDTSISRIVRASSLRLGETLRSSFDSQNSTSLASKKLEEQSKGSTGSSVASSVVSIIAGSNTRMGTESTMVGQTLSLVSRYLAWCLTADSSHVAYRFDPPCNSTLMMIHEKAVAESITEDFLANVLQALTQYPEIPEDVELLASISLLVAALNYLRVAKSDESQDKKSNKKSSSSLPLLVRSRVEAFSTVQWKAIAKAVKRHTGWVYDDSIVKEATKLLEDVPTIHPSRQTTAVAFRPNVDTQTTGENPVEVTPSLLCRLCENFDFWMCMQTRDNQRLAKVLLLCSYRSSETSEVGEVTKAATDCSLSVLGSLSRNQIRLVLRFLLPQRTECPPRDVFLSLAR